ncbi:MAG: GAF domain-containing protein [Sphingobacteriales bacterium]|nr:MAG: GAF domain-containing protein [Sphingobacteriales bacterium]
MEIFNIENKDAINITNCDEEPIHIPGSIQPHGYLLALHKKDLTVAFCSNNCPNLFGKPTTALLGAAIGSLITEEELTTLQTKLTEEKPDYSQPIVFTINGQECNVLVHMRGDWTVLEIEPFPDGRMNLPDLYSYTSNFVTHINQADTLQALCQAIAQQTRDITGYDRVMIYRFDDNYNGEVFAEALRDDLLPFLGHHYPHTDIPVQARQLYMLNMMRMIVDIDYAPVPIVTKNKDADNTQLDLSLSILRSVSSIHLEYLRNMGVKATLTISLIQDNKLWGMISCHHYTARNIPYFTRLSALLQGHFLTSQIRVREVQEEYKRWKQIENTLHTLQETINHSPNFVEEILGNKELLEMTDATGAIIGYNGLIESTGDVPKGAELDKMIAALRTAAKGQMYSTAKLKDIIALGSDYAGAIFIPLTEQDFIIWLKPEIVKHIYWAGNPTKAVEMDKGTSRLTPRKSFELYAEEVKDQSTPWSTPELRGAGELAYALQNQLLIKYAQENELRYKQMNAKLTHLNTELSTFNWISSHDLKEPLRKIQILISSITHSSREPQVNDKVTHTLTRIEQSARNMQTYVDDIALYSKVDTSGVPVPVDLNNVIERVLKTNGWNDDERYQFSIAKMPTVLGYKDQLELLFKNLFDNATKFSNGNVQISVDCKLANSDNSMAGNYYEISLTDNGIGFEHMYAEKIFLIFQRLHNRDKYPGSGIGLALCKKIMTNHNGDITARSTAGEGSVFKLYFPQDKTEN